MTDLTSSMQDIRQEACYDSELDMIFIPFKDSNVLFSDLFQTCVTRLSYRNLSETMSYINKIDKKENFLGPSRIEITVAYQDKNKDEPEAQASRVVLSPEQVNLCSETEQLPLNSNSNTLIITSASAGFFIIIIIVSLVIFFIRRKKAKKPKTGVDTNPEYGADYYYKQNEETYVQYVT